MIRILLYGDIKRRVGRRELELDVHGKSMREILAYLAEKYNIGDLIYRDGKVRGELLIIVDGADWNSLGYLDEEVRDGSTIKIVPVWHGG